MGGDEPGQQDRQQGLPAEEALAFKTELCKDEATLQEARLEAKGKSSNKDDLKILQSALTALQASQKKIEKVISGGCKKEAAKEALLDSFAALEKGKKCKKLFGPIKKKTSDGED